MTCSRKDSREAKIWQVLNHRVDAAGATVWRAMYTNTSGNSNAGEYILARREGGYATLVDSGSARRRARAAGGWGGGSPVVTRVCAVARQVVSGAAFAVSALGEGPVWRLSGGRRSDGGCV